MWVNGRVHDGGLHGNPWPEVFGRAWERSFLRTFLVATYQSRLISSGTLDVVKRWIAVSEFMRDKFISAGIPAEKIVTLRHCWKPRAVPDASRMGGHYLFLGRLVPEKGVRLFAQAIRRTGLPAVFIGDGELREELHELCPEARFTGWLTPEETRAALKKKEEPGYMGTFSGARRYVMHTFANTQSALMKKRVSQFMLGADSDVFFKSPAAPPAGVPPELWSGCSRLAVFTSPTNSAR